MNRPVGVDERHVQLGKLATDTDVADAITAHAATPHGGTHPDLATHDSLGLATDTELADAITLHEAAPHGGSDGSPPASSPAPEIVGLPGALHVKWDPVVNADPVTYKVYVLED